MTQEIKHWIFEGIDRLGKDSLISNIQNYNGFYQVVHYSKPIPLAQYDGSLYEYQRSSFGTGFDILNSSARTIFNRFHLGEFVYAPLYRDYSGEYIFELECEYSAREMSDTRLILLTTSNFSILKDDGLSFDFNRKEEEQDRFIEAYARSAFPDKRIIDVYDQVNNCYKHYDRIYEEATS